MGRAGWSWVWRAGCLDHDCPCLGLHGHRGAVVISGRAKYVRDVGRSTALGFAAVFTLYLIISMLSLGIMPRAEMAQLATPSMAGILERAIGPVGAAIVNLGVILSLVGAMLGYVIIASETPFEAARQVPSVGVC